MDEGRIIVGLYGVLRYKWRIDLSQTEKHWSGWFKGLSSAFLSVGAPRLLLLASIDGLDRELTVGQMQGILSALCTFPII